MRVLIFGATGMIGRGVLRECLLDPAVRAVTTVGRAATGVQALKLQEIVHANIADLSTIEDRLKNFDACFFTLGVSSAGKSEDEYKRLTYDLTISAARTLARLNSGMTFIYVSGTGTDSSEKGRVMWARIKGRTENEILRTPFKAAYMFRIAGVEGVHGERSKAPASRIAYAVLKPFIPLLRRLMPGYILTTEEIGRAMIEAVRRGAPKRILESKDIREYLATL